MTGNNKIIKNGICKLHGSNVNERALLQVHVISKLNRKDLEDHYYKMLDNNLGLKRKLNSLIEKYKILNAKYIRLDEQRKASGKTDVACNKILQETVESQMLHIYSLEEYIKKLLDKINALKHKILSHKQVLISINESESSTIKNNVKFVEEIAEASCDENKQEDDTIILEKDIELLKKENEDLKNYIYNNRIETHKNEQKINEELEYSKDNESIIRSEAVDIESKSFKDAIVQTEEEFKIDLLRQQIAEEQIKIFELESNAKYSKLSDNVLKEFNHRLETLREKCLNDSKMTIHNNELETNNQDLQKRLDNLHVERMSLETINKDLMSTILSMQSEMDTLQLTINTKKEYQNAAQTSEIRHSVNDNIKIIISTDKKWNSSNDSDKQTNSTEEHSSSLNKNIDSNDENVSIHSSHEIIEQDLKSNSIADNIMNDESASNCEDIVNVTEKHIESVKNTEEISVLKMKTDDAVKSNGKVENKSSTDDKSFDDATYDISANDEANSNSLHSSIDGYLSDGEVQKYSGKARIPIKISKLSNISERIDISQRAELTLQTLSVEMQKSKTLMESLYNDKKINKKRIRELSDINKIRDKIENTNNAQFILHIISAELTEQTVADLNKTSFFLTWKFYHNAIAYTPLSDNEIFDFHYSSTCDLAMNQSLKDYFMNESIDIDIHKRDVDTSLIFASCSLVLKDILINANRKNTFTLSLVKPVDSSECGKLNIWCQLNYNDIL